MKKSTFHNASYESLKLPKKHLPRIESAKDLQDAKSLKELPNHVGEDIYLNGWISNVRSSGKIYFIQFRDGRGDLQIVAEKANLSEKTWVDVEELTLESSVQVFGTVKEDDRAPGGYEMLLKDLTIIQISPEYPITNKEHGVDFLLDNRHLWLRSKKQRAVLKIRDEIFFSLQKFLREEDFIRIDTPIFQPVSCEDTSDLFEVDYFGEKTYLTQSGQLYCEAAEFALGKTYDFGPVFRAEKSKTRKHLIEFWMMDAELPFTDLDGLMNFEEKLMKQLVEDCLENCKPELEILERDIKKLEHYVEADFIRISHKDTIALLNDKFNAGLGDLEDIGAPEEQMLSEIYDVPVFIYDWPADIKAFYMPRFQNKGDVKRVRALDLVAPEGFGEIIGGAERIFHYNDLLGIIDELDYKYEDYAWYMDLRKYGTIPHCGFGIGLERTVRFISGVKHIRETIPFPRMLNRLYP